MLASFIRPGKKSPLGVIHSPLGVHAVHVVRQSSSLEGEASAVRPSSELGSKDGGVNTGFGCQTTISEDADKKEIQAFREYSKKDLASKASKS